MMGDPVQSLSKTVHPEVAGPKLQQNRTLYLAVVLDLFSRFVAGWAVSAVNDRHVTIKGDFHNLL